MSWLQVNVDEIKQEQEKVVNGEEYELLEPDVYDLVLQSCYIDMTQNGTEYINFEFKTEDNKDVYITGWDVRRMIRNASGEVKNRKGAYFNGIILLNMFAEQINKDVSSLTPQQITKEIWNEQRQVISFNELLNKKYTVGIRHRKTFNQDGDEKIKLEIVAVIDPKDEEAKQKMQEKIKKRPLLEDKSQKTTAPKQDSNSENIPF